MLGRGVVDLMDRTGRARRHRGRLGHLNHKAGRVAARAEWEKHA